MDKDETIGCLSILGIGIAIFFWKQILLIISFIVVMPILFWINKSVLKLCCEIGNIIPNKYIINSIAGLLLVPAIFLFIVTKGIVLCRSLFIVYLLIIIIELISVCLIKLVIKLGIFLKNNYYYNHADKLYKQNKYKEALNYYNKVLKYTNKENPYCYYAIGLCEKKLSHYNKAIRNINKAIELDKTKPEFYYAIAEIYIGNKNYKTALTNIERALELSAHNKMIKNMGLKLKEEIKSYSYEYYKQAVDLIKNKEYSEATKKLEQALSILPDDSEYLEKANEIKNKLNAVKEEEKQEKLKRQKEQADNYFKQAKEAYTNGLYDAAITAIYKAINILNNTS